MVRSLRARIAGVIISLAICSTIVSWGQGRTKLVECSGMVVDGQGNPVAQAEVICAEQWYDYAAGRTVWHTPGRGTTGADGKFSVQAEAERKEYVWAVAWKDGLSLGWQWFRTAPAGESVMVQLSEPAVLAGVVVDESGKPVAGATVRPSLKMAWMGGSPGIRLEEPRERLSSRTDDQGGFRFDYIPAAASADFWVQAPGQASCWTQWSSDLEGSQFKAGQTDIRIVLKPEAIVRGRVLDEDSGKGVAGVLLLARPNARYANYSCVDPIASGPDGAFIYRGLAAGDYSIQIVAPQNRIADWTGRDVKVTVVAGQTVDVNVPVSKGGLIEIMIQDAATGSPIENARTTVSQEANFGIHPCWYHSVYADAEGLVRLRVPAGECRLMTWADSYQYVSDSEPATVAKGEVLRRQVKLDAFPAVTGTVRDPNGRPTAGVIVSSKPACEKSMQTDEQGRFKVTWRPSANVRNVLVLARDPDRNLAGLADVKDQSQPVDVTLVPAFTIRGRITDPNGKEISAAVGVRASMPGWYTNVAPDILTDANGFYEARAIPAQREDFTYRLQVGARGYGPTEVRILPFDAAQDRRVMVETVVLPVADKSLSGVVVDANGVPAPGRPIFITGPRGSDTAGQPRIETVSDAQGRFAVDGVCAGPLRIQASFSSSPGGVGMLDAQGGDRDVRVILGRSGVHTEIKSLLGKSLPDMKSILDLPAEQTQGKPILLCFFDMDQRPSRNCIDNLVKQSDALRQKGLVLAAIQTSPVQEDAWKTWTAERGTRLAFGRIQENAENVKSAWGVQSLPWLILTDSQHVVRAEGFAVNELDARLRP